MSTLELLISGELIETIPLQQKGKLIEERQSEVAAAVDYLKWKYCDSLRLKSNWEIWLSIN